MWMQHLGDVLLLGARAANPEASEKQQISFYFILLFFFNVSFQGCESRFGRERGRWGCENPVPTVGGAVASPQPAAASPSRNKARGSC